MFNIKRWCFASSLKWTLRDSLKSLIKSLKSLKRVQLHLVRKTSWYTLLHSYRMDVRLLLRLKCFFCSQENWCNLPRARFLVVLQFFISVSIFYASHSVLVVAGDRNYNQIVTPCFPVVLLTTNSTWAWQIASLLSEAFVLFNNSNILFCKVSTVGVSCH